MLNSSEDVCRVQGQDKSTALWQRYRNGDDNALEELVTIYRDDLLYFINGYIHNITTAEDILSETFLRLIFRAKNFSAESSLKTYLYKIAANRAIDELRKISRKPTKSLDDIEYLASEEKTLEELVLLDEKRKILCSAMQKLNPTYRAVLYLTYFQNLSCEETAKVIRKNRKQTENLIYRAKLSLKVILQKEGYHDENL